MDAEAETDWKPVAEIRSGLPRIVSTGWLLGESRTELILASDLGGNDTNRRIRIPKPVIQSITEIDLMTKGRKIDIQELIQRDKTRKAPKARTRRRK